MTIGPKYWNAATQYRYIGKNTNNKGFLPRVERAAYPRTTLRDESSITDPISGTYASLDWISHPDWNPVLPPSLLLGRATPLLQLHAEDRLQPSAGKVLLLELDRNQTNAAKLAEKVR